MSQLLLNIQNLIKSENLIEAEELAWALYGQNKKDVIALKTLGLTLLMQRKYKGALDIYNHANSIKKNDFDIVNNIGHLSLQLEEFKQAEEFSIIANQLNPDAYQPYITLADVNLRKRNFDKAYDYIIEMQKRVTFEVLITNHQTLYLMLDIFIACNKEEEAMGFINHSYTKKFIPEIFYYHAGLKSSSISKELIKVANDVIKNAKFKNHITKAKTLGPIYFGLGKYYLGKDQALSDINYIQGNSEIGEIQRFRPLETQRFLKNLKKTFNQNEFIPKNLENDGANLIFVCGMPRSGTTLLESIVCSSGEVCSCGELVSLSDLFSKYTDPDINGEIDSKIFENDDEGDNYLRRINFLNSFEKKNYVLDKLPGNFYLIGFIKKRFPKSKILYVKRDPWDNAISLFQQFYVVNIPYAASFFNIAVYYANHEEIMRYWAEDLKIDFMTINYEDLVSDTDTIANKVYNYCGFSSSYNSASREGFFSRTASKSQVRGEIHKKSIKKQAFEQQKKEFLDNLSIQREYWK